MLLIVAVVGAFLFLFNEIDPSVLDETETTEAPVTSVPSTSTPSTSAPSGQDNIHYAIDAKAGYVVVNDYTYFFSYYDNQYSSTVFWKSHNNGEEVSNWDIKPYSNYELYIASSYDGLKWELDEYDFHDFPVRAGERFFISYTRIKNCSNPDYVLQDLVQNVFTNHSYFHFFTGSAAG